MGFVIEEETAAPTGFVIEETPAPKPLGALETFTGGMGDILNKLTYFGDEIIAGGSTLLGDAYTGAANMFGANRQPENYDANLAQIRDLTTRYQAENPVSSALNNAAAFLVPIPGAGTKAVTTAAPVVKAAPSVFKTAGKGAAVGSVFGGASGFGNAEGGLENRLKSGLTGAIIGAGVGGAVPMVIGGAGKVAGYVSDKFDDGAAAVREQGMGVMYGDRTRGLKNLPQYLDESGNVVDRANATTVSAPIEEQIALLSKKGILQAAPNAPRPLQTFLTKQELQAGDEVGKLISEADQALGPQVLPVPFKETAQFFEQLGKQNPAKAEELAGDFARLVENYNKAGTGVNPVTGQASQSSVGALTRINAVKAGTKADIPMWQQAGDKPKVALYRAMYRDLQQLEDDVFNATLPNKAGAFKEAKDLYGALQAVGTTITKAGARKAPTLGNALEGGSKLPATIFAATTPILGPGGATVATGAYMVGRGGKNLVQNAYPMTVANLYDKAGSATGGISNLLQSGANLASGAIPAASSAIGAAMAEKEAPSSGMIPAQPVQQAGTPQAQPSELDQKYSEAINRALSGLNSGETMEDAKPQVEDVQSDRAPAGSAAEDLVQAVVLQESANKKNPKGDPKAVSIKGAQGLMQLMPATGREWHKKLGLPGEYDPFDPEQNKTIGTAYLNYLLDMYDGDQELALTAYNQGFGRVNKLLARTKGKSLEDIIEFLGPDGQGYAKGVLSKLETIRKNGQVRA